VDNERLSLGWTVAGMGNTSFVYSNSNVRAVFGDVGADNVSEMRYHANLVPSFS
jgi:predicted transcriptional regulator